jgi:hypothetical protein
VITLSDGTTVVTLHPDLFWSDEMSWQPVEQKTERTITGALVVQTGTRIAGRPITLEPEADNSAWMHRSVVEQLRNWASVPGKTLTLNLRSESIDVIFRHQDNTAFEARPVLHYSDVQATDWYRCVIRLMTI